MKPSLLTKVQPLKANKMDDRSSNTNTTRKLNKNASHFTPSSSLSHTLSARGLNSRKIKRDKKSFSPEAVRLIKALLSGKDRVKVVMELNDRREREPRLAELLWHTPGVVVILLEGMSQGHCIERNM